MPKEEFSAFLAEYRRRNPDSWVIPKFWEKIWESEQRKTRAGQGDFSDLYKDLAVMPAHESSKLPFYTGLI